MWICPECKAENHSTGIGCECCGYKKQPVNIDKKPRRMFTNDITKKLEGKSYTIGWRPQVLKDISLKLNNYYSDSITSAKLKEVIKDILNEHSIPITKKALEAYRLYFEESGQLQRQSKRLNKGFVYEIIRNNLIPKKKEERNLGVLDELGM